MGRGHLNVVHDGHHGAAVVGEPSAQLEGALLMGDVQGSRRFVKKDDTRFLSENSRQSHPRTFAP